MTLLLLEENVDHRDVGQWTVFDCIHCGERVLTRPLSMPMPTDNTILAAALEHRKVCTKQVDPDPATAIGDLLTKPFAPAVGSESAASAAPQTCGGATRSEPAAVATPAASCFSIGDVVRLKSGGALMTVAGCKRDPQPTDDVTVHWHDGAGQLQTAHMRAGTLQPATITLRELTHVSRQLTVEQTSEPLYAIQYTTPDGRMGLGAERSSLEYISAAAEKARKRAVENGCGYTYRAVPTNSTEEYRFAADDETLRAALRAAVRECGLHNSEYKHRTSQELIAEWRRLATEPKKGDS